MSDGPGWLLALTLLPPRPRPDDWICWPDFGLPMSGARARVAIVEAWRRSETGRVTIGCGGGIGRTGTALAVCGVLDGLTADQSIALVRRAYHRGAVETPWQRRWVSDVDRLRNAVEFRFNV